VTQGQVRVADYSKFDAIKLWYNAFAFVALVKPLDFIEGLQVHTCTPFFTAEGRQSHQIAQTEEGFS
jgi:hypothetical protein